MLGEDRPPRQSRSNSSKRSERRQEGARPGCPAPRGLRSSLARDGNAAPLSGPRSRAPSPSGLLALTGCLVRSLTRPPAGLHRGAAPRGTLPLALVSNAPRPRPAPL